MLERKTTEARLRYRQSMSLSAHFDPVSEAPPGLQRMRSRNSFFAGSRVEPSSFLHTDVKSPRQQMLHRTASSLARERVHKTNFEGGVMSPSEIASVRNRRINSLTTPRTNVDDETPRSSTRNGKKIVKNESPLGEGSMVSVGSGGAGAGAGSISINNNSFGMNALISPERTSRSGVGSDFISPKATDVRFKAHIKVNTTARGANNMDTSNLVPQRKQSRWSRKKSIDAGKAAFLAMTSPKKYGFNKPPLEPTPTIGHGTEPTKHHRKNFEMVVSARQAVLPPWATDR